MSLEFSLFRSRREGHQFSVDTTTGLKMVATDRHLAFSNGAPVLNVNRNSFFVPDPNWRYHRPAQPRRWAVRNSKPASMSLVNDIIIKGVEAGVAAFLGNAVSMQQAAKSEKKGTFFGLGGKKSKPSTNSNDTLIDPVSVISEVMRMAESIPEIVERGGPEAKKWVKLAICLAIDLVGAGNLGVPILGDLLDLVTAPISAVMLQALYGSTFITVAEIAEELLPGTDAIPTATLAWLAEQGGYLNVKTDRDTETG